MEEGKGKKKKGLKGEGGRDRYTVPNQSQAQRELWKL